MGYRSISRSSQLSCIDHRGGGCLISALAHGGLYLVILLAHRGAGLRMYSAHPEGTYVVILALDHRGRCLVHVLVHGGRKHTPCLYARPQGTAQGYVPAFAHKGGGALFLH